eukprot:TRINITY_DN241_c0_g3_i2.p1 TRINITY_DN241_c0_g3~~TRINITY_DN241_c0_g3_i2.p1  ORF type:complete len:237 (-),score=85.41 TRINITY_DN241_c0_g3_i2:265-975(-)
MLRAFSQASGKMPKIALVLSGCGVYDGSEVTEAVSCLIHLSKHKEIEISKFAPNKDQMHVINHIAGEPIEGETRNVMVESARITRGDITDLKELAAKDFDAVIIPGGFGAAKNLSTFAVDGADMKVDEEFERVLKEFHSSKKPIGACCIAPVVLSTVLKGCSVTMGQEEGEGWPFAGATGAVKANDSVHVPCDNIECFIDEANKVVTSAAFMCSDSSFYDVFTSVGNMVDGVVKML